MSEDLNLDEFSGGNLYKGRDFEDGPEYHTISDVTVAEFRDGRRKPVLTFIDADKQAPLGPLNVKKLKSDFGERTSQWIGRTVMLMAGPDFNGNPSLIVLPQKPQKAAKGAAGAAPKDDGAAPAISDEDIPF